MQSKRAIRVGLEQMLFKLDGMDEPATSVPHSARRDPQVEALLGGGADAWRDAFAGAGDRVSSLIHEHLADRPASIPLRGVKVRTARDMAALVLPLRTPFVESMKAAWIGENGRVLALRVISLGCLDSAQIDWRGLIRNVPAGTVGVVIAHNHPSGNPIPSFDDQRITKVLVEACRDGGVPLLDHVITNGRTFYSFAGDGTVDGLPGLPGVNLPGMNRLVAEDGAEYHQGSPWERVPREKLPVVNNPNAFRGLVDALRQANPGMGHVLFLSTKNNLLAVERVEVPKDASVHEWRNLKEHIVRGSAIEGASGILLDLPMDMDETMMIALRRLGTTLGRAEIQLLDTLGKSGESCRKSVHLSESPMEYDGVSV
jgi:DNA repair protein RadC